MPAIKLENVSFGYTKKERVLKGINLDVPMGSIYGFLGANGAGKTTTMRLILGLLKPQGGSIKIQNEDISKSYPKHYKHVGSLIENASLYQHLSASDNLRIWSKYFNVSSSRVDEVLQIVELQKAGKKQINSFSTGMKQRLGLAIALLHDPQVLLLDEPTNGLDPMGIIDLRNLLQKLSDQGKTILLSSHILPEVEKIVTQLGIIKGGSMVFEGTMHELKELRQTNISVYVKVNDVNTALELIDTKYNPIIEDDLIRITVDRAHELPIALRSILDNGIDVYEFVPQNKDLEDLFLSVAQN